MSELVILGNEMQPLWETQHKIVVLEECDLSDLRPTGVVESVQELTLEYCRVNPASLRAWLHAFPNLRRLYLSGLPLGKLHWGQLPAGLEELILTGGRLKELLGAPQELPLQTLHLQACQLQQLDLPERLPALLDLNLSYNADLRQMPKLPQSLSNFKLNLTGCGLVDFPDGNRVDRVEALTISSNPIRVIPESIGKWMGLRTLIAAKSALVRIHSELANCRGIRHLNLKDNPLAHWPLGISELRKLEKLDLTRTQLMEVPDSVGNLRSLSVIKLDDNPITRISDSLTRLERLESLSLWKSSLFDLPHDFSGLKSLRQLDLSYNPATRLPDLRELKNLRFLGLAGLRQLDWPEAFAMLSELRQCHQISLTNSNFKEFDGRLFRIPGLRRLDINGTLPAAEYWQKAGAENPEIVIWGA